MRWMMRSRDSVVKLGGVGLGGVLLSLVVVGVFGTRGGHDEINMKNRIEWNIIDSFKLVFCRVLACPLG